MKRYSFFGFIILLLFLIAGLGRTAIEPDQFTGQWYSADDHNIYLFQEGLVYCSEHGVSVSDSISLSGVYSFCRDSVFMFAAGVEGLETEREIYLVSDRNKSFLCERKDRTGKIYFIRSMP